MSSNENTQDQDQDQSQNSTNPTQSNIPDNFSEPETDGSMGSSSLFGEPSSYFSQIVAYGTNINLPQAASDIRTFLHKFNPENTPEGTEALYISKIREIEFNEEYTLEVDMQHVNAFNGNIYNQMINFPLEMIQLFDQVVTEIFISICRDPDRGNIQICPHNLLETKSVRELKPSDIDKLVSIQGMIIRCSHIIPDLSTAKFVCRNCGNYTEVPVTNGTIVDTQHCDRCNSNNTLEIEHNLSTFVDRQHIKVQESPEFVQKGESPQTISAVAFDKLVDSTTPGDRVVLTGVWRAIPARVNPRIRVLHSVYRTYLDIVHVNRNLKSAIQNEESNEAKTAQEREARKRRVEELSKDQDICDKLIKSFAPAIWKMEDQKRGLLCLLFGGSVTKRQARGDINILLVGDPATAKSQLIQFTHKISPRGLYTSGKGSSAVGLTASVVRDPETGDFVLESGALVLSDRGICCIDEFDKMNDSARSILHEVMEQQTVSIAKAGIICTLNARASIVACANPRDSTYNTSLSVVDNIRLPPTLLSRFDLVYLVLDSVNEARDKELAKHIITLYTTRDEVETPLTPAQLSEYISYAKENCNPVLTDDAEDLLIQGYIEMRSIGGRNVVSATPRQLESCIRLSEAHAKMRLSPEVTPEDVKIALELMKEALHQSATDPSTGLIDMDLISTGLSSETRHRINTISREIINYLRAQKDGTSSVQALFNAIKANISNITENQLNDALFGLESDNKLYIKVENTRPVRATLL